MGRLLVVAAVAAVVSSGARADGWPPYLPEPSSGNHGWGPHATSVTWPSVNPPGWYTNTYNHAWFYPWYANYNFSHGPYANWMSGGGRLGYANHGPAGYYNWPNVKPAQPYVGEWADRAAAAPPTKAQAKFRAKIEAHEGAYAALNGLVGTPLGKPREANPLPKPMEKEKEKAKDGK